MISGACANRVWRNWGERGVAIEIVYEHGAGVSKLGDAWGFSANARARGMHAPRRHTGNAPLLAKRSPPLGALYGTPTNDGELLLF